MESSEEEKPHCGSNKTPCQKDAMHWSPLQGSLPGSLRSLPITPEDADTHDWLRMAD